MLRIEGFEVRIYCDADELLQDCPLPNNACLVIDHILPGMSGLDLVAAMRARTLSLPAILITTHPTAALCKCARSLDVPIGMIRSRLSRGRESLRTLMNWRDGTEAVNGAAVTRTVPKRLHAALRMRHDSQSTNAAPASRSGRYPGNR